MELTSLGVLQLENVEPGDQGTYRCVATNDARVRRSNDARLHVNAATGSGQWLCRCGGTRILTL